MENDKILTEIALREDRAKSLRREADVLIRKAEVFEAEARGLKMAAGIPLDLPQRIAAPSERYMVDMRGVIPARKSGGRQHGAISTQWRRILQRLYKECPGGFSDINDVPIVAEQEGIKIRPKHAKERMAHYASNNLVQKQSDGRYVVTQNAVLKFQLESPLESERLQLG